MKQITLFILIFHNYVTFGQTPSDTLINKQCKVEIFLIEKTIAPFSKKCSHCFSPAASDLPDSAFINDNEITGYEIINNKHYLLFNESAKQKLDYLKNSSNTSLPFVTKRFAIVIDGQPIYGGWFKDPYSTSPIDWIAIPLDLDKENTGKLCIYKGYMGGKTPKKYGDPRNNKLLFDCLKKSNRLKTSTE